MKKMVAIFRTSSAVAIPAILVVVSVTLIAGGNLRQVLIVTLVTYVLVALPLAWIAVGVVALLNKHEQEEDDEMREHVD